MDLIASQIISQIIAFLIMLWILKKFAFKPIMRILEERKKKIEKEFLLIDEGKLELEKSKKEFQKKVDHLDDLAKEKMNDHINKGHEIALEIENKAREHAKVILSKAKVNAERELSNAKSNLKNDLIELTFDALHQILKNKLDIETQRKMVTEFFDEVKFK